MANGNAVPALPRGEGGKGDAPRPARPHLADSAGKSAILLFSIGKKTSSPPSLSTTWCIFLYINKHIQATIAEQSFLGQAAPSLVGPALCSPGRAMQLLPGGGRGRNVWVGGCWLGLSVQESRYPLPLPFLSPPFPSPPLPSPCPFLAYHHTSNSLPFFTPHSSLFCHVL